MMSTKLALYAEVAGHEVIDHLRQLARPLAGKRIVHVNSTRVGGGVAEILEQLIPMPPGRSWRASPIFSPAQKISTTACRGVPSR
jgi:hypothetical protein